MAKDLKTAPKGPLADQVAVRLHSKHAATEDVYEILVGARRVAYIGAGEGKGVNFLTPQTLKGGALTKAEQIEIAKRAKELMKAINEKEASEQAELDKLILGEE